MFNLSARIAGHPINDGPYLRHLRSADVFNALADARETAKKALADVNDAMRAHEEAVDAYEKQLAIAEIFESMEGL